MRAASGSSSTPGLGLPQLTPSPGSRAPPSPAPRRRRCARPPARSRPPRLQRASLRCTCTRPPAARGRPRQRTARYPPFPTTARSRRHLASRRATPPSPLSLPLSFPAAHAGGRTPPPRGRPRAHWRRPQAHLLRARAFRTAGGAARPRHSALARRRGVRADPQRGRRLSRPPRPFLRSRPPSPPHRNLPRRAAARAGGPAAAARWADGGGGGRRRRRAQMVLTAPASVGATNELPAMLGAGVAAFRGGRGAGRRRRRAGVGRLCGIQLRDRLWRKR